MMPNLQKSRGVPFLRQSLLSLGLLSLAACGACSSNPSLPGPGSLPASDPSASAQSPIDPEAIAHFSKNLVAAELSTVGWDRLTQTPVVLLRVADSDSVLPIWIGIAEARAIQMALLERIPPRPMTHDLMVETLRSLNAELEAVIVHELRDNTFFGLLKVRREGDGQPLYIDTRPSDGLALAARTGARIEVSRHLVDQAPQFDFQAPDSAQQVVRAVGLTVVALTDEWRQEHGVPAELNGVVVTDARDHALARGLRAGDLLLEAQGQPLTEPQDLLDAIDQNADEKTLSLLYWRDGEQNTVELNLDPPPPAEKRMA